MKPISDDPLIGARTNGGGVIEQVYGSAGGIVLCTIRWGDDVRTGGILRDWITKKATMMEDLCRAMGFGGSL